MKTYLKSGGIAALLHGAAYIVGLVIGVTFVFPVLTSTDPGQHAAFIAQYKGLVYIWNLISYWGSAITVVIMALALYHRLRAGSPALVQTATIFGLIWATLIIGSANLMLRDSGVIAGLYAQDPAGAAALWQALQAVENGIVSGNELVGSLWVLLISLAAIRTGAFSRAFNYFGVAISLAGILTIVPGLFDITVMIFGPGMIVWSFWLGVALLRESRGASRQPVSQPAAVNRPAERTEFA
jgi:hypothetical protein